MAASRDWVSNAKRLLGVKESGGWQTTHSSFSAWLRDEAKRLDVQPSALWRHVSALEFYLSFGSNYDGLQLPGVDDVRFNVSPQHLELIEKLARSADRGTIRDLLMKALSGGVTRSQLLEQWHVYRSKGQLSPRRGRGVSKKERETRAASPELPPTEAKALVQLMQALPDWTGSKAPTSYRTFATPVLSKISRRRFDLIVLCRPEANQSIAVHGVEIIRTNSINARLLHMVANHLTPRAKLLHYVWIALAADQAVPEAMVQETLSKLPQHIGLLQILESEVVVLRAASRQSGLHSGPLLAELLLQA